MVARSRVLLLERRLVLLIHNDESEIAERQEERRARAEYHPVGIVGQLPLPYLHPFGVAVFGMVYAQAVAEDVAQTLHYLHRERNLRQQIEHLTALAQRLVNEMDVYFGLAARRHAVQQCHILCPERVLYLVKSLPLGVSERLHVLGMRLAAVAHTPHLTFVYGEKAARNKRVQDSGGGVRLVQQFLTRKLRHRVARASGARLVPSAHGKKALEELSLLSGTCLHEHVESHMQRLPGAHLLGQSDATLRLGAISVLVLQSARQRSLEHIAKRRHVVVGYPLPEPQLQTGDNGVRVGQREYVLHVERRFLSVRPEYDADVFLAASERHNDPHPGLHGGCHAVGHGIGEDAFERKWEYDVCVNHKYCKITYLWLIRQTI